MMQDVAVIIVGGLGKSQLGDLRDAITSQCPDAAVVWGGDWDAWRDDIAGMIASHPAPKLALVGHSFGCDAILRASPTFSARTVAYFAAIDPVGENWQRTADVAPNIKLVDWWQRGEWFGPPCMELTGQTPVVVEGGHNDLPHNPGLIAAIVARLNALTPPAPADAAAVSPPGAAGTETGSPFEREISCTIGTDAKRRMAT